MHELTAKYQVSGLEVELAAIGSFQNDHPKISEVIYRICKEALKSIYYQNKDEGMGYCDQSGKTLKHSR